MENRNEFLEKIRNGQMSEQQLEKNMLEILKHVAGELETLTDGLSMFLQMVEDNELDSKDDLKLQLIHNRLSRFLGDANGMVSSTQRELQQSISNEVEVERE